MTRITDLPRTRIMVIASGNKIFGGGGGLNYVHDLHVNIKRLFLYLLGRKNNVFMISS
jgi:hypothetical protein